MNIIFLKNVNQLRKCRSNPCSIFIFYTLNSLTNNLFNNHCEVFFGAFVFSFAEIHEYSNKWCLTICGHQSEYLILDCLYATLNLVSQSLFNDAINAIDVTVTSGNLFFNIFPYFLSTYINEWCKMCKRNTLTTILIGCNLRNSLCCYITSCRKAVWFFNQRIRYYRSVL